ARPRACHAAEPAAARRDPGRAAADGRRPDAGGPGRAQSPHRDDDPARGAHPSCGGGARVPGRRAPSRHCDCGRRAREGRARSRSRPIPPRRGGALMLRIEERDLFCEAAPVLEGISLVVDQGSIVTVAGGAEAGKTSLIRAIAGMHRPARGSIRFRGTEIAGLPSHRVCNLGIGQVAQGRQIFATLSVNENLEIGAMLPRARAQRRQNRDRVYALFSTLAERSRQSAGRLSTAQQQMLAIGRCLMGAPELVLFDEPTLGLAPKEALAMLKTIPELNVEGLACLLADQNVAVALKLAARGYVLESGRIALAGSGSALLQDDRVRQAYLGF